MEQKLINEIARAILNNAGNATSMAKAALAAIQEEYVLVRKNNYEMAFGNPQQYEIYTGDNKKDIVG